TPRLDRHGVVKLPARGLARLLPAGDDPRTAEQLTEERVVMGTPDFMAPEQALDAREADIRSDLYSLGCTLYFLLTGQPPFPGGSMLDKVAKHAKEKARPVEEVRPEVPPAVSHVVERLLAKDPQERFQTPSELVAALEPLAVDAPPPW